MLHGAGRRRSGRPAPRRMSSVTPTTTPLGVVHRHTGPVSPWDVASEPTRTEQCQHAVLKGCARDTTPQPCPDGPRSWAWCRREYSATMAPAMEPPSDAVSHAALHFAKAWSRTGSRSPKTRRVTIPPSLPEAAIPPPARRRGPATAESRPPHLCRPHWTDRARGNHCGRRYLLRPASSTPRPRTHPQRSIGS